MKNASADLIDFLNNNPQCRIVDLYTITLQGGQIYRWSSGDAPVFANGHNFILGPVIDRSKLSSSLGVSASELSVDIYAYSGDLIEGVPLLKYLVDQGLDGALLKIDRAYFSPGSNVPVGTLIWFYGRFTEIEGLSRTQVSLKASDWRILLNVNMPSSLFVPGCRHSVYNAGCGLNQASFKASGIVASPISTNQCGSNLVNPSGYFDLGWMTFTSGINEGITRTIKSQSGSILVFASPLTELPAIGDTFDIYPGCYRDKPTCSTKFNNLIHYGGTPETPIPEVAVG